MAKLVKSLVLVAAVLGLATAAPSESEAALETRIPTMATSPQVIAAAADPRVYAALVEAYPGADHGSPRDLSYFCDDYVDLYNPKCHNCNGGGCGVFECSDFTTWDACKAGWEECGLEECEVGFCTAKPTCGRRVNRGRKPVSGLRGE